MIKTIIFDFFEVIRKDPYKAWLKKHDYARTGEYFDIAEKMDNGQIQQEEFFKGLSKLSGQPHAEVLAAFDPCGDINVEVVEVIKSLSNRYTIGLLSNAPSRYLRDILQKNDLENLFTEIVISSEVQLTKPSRKIFETALSRLQSPASEAVFIDDNPEYVKAAQAVGLQGIVFENADQLNKDLKALGV